MTKKRKLQEGKKSQPERPSEGGPSLPKKKAYHDKRARRETVTITDINVASFAEHRAIEIQAMAELVKDTGGNHTAFQKLPRHMRRRAMSHNIKRIPRRLHSVAKQELSKTKAPGKRPSRRHRRRPSNLLAEYERRKRRVGWLETHIWHAKRFKMVEKWGYRLALNPNDKSIRACYRAVKRHCLLQDVSYEAFIELKGPRQTILDGLTHLTSTETGPTFAAKMAASGTRQGQLVLYSFDSYPYQAIGPVTYLWRAWPEHPAASSDDTLWVSCHPSIYSSVLSEIRKCFGSQTAAENASSQDVEDGEQIPELKDENGVIVTSLKDQLVKFRLFGPASNLVLTETLKLADVEDSSNTAPSAGTEDVVTSDAMWWKKFYASSVNKQLFSQQSDSWSRISKCQSPSEVAPGCVLALTVRDPRLMLPPKRNKVSLAGADSLPGSLPLDLFSDGIAASPLWEPWVRDKVKVTKMSEQQLNLMKSKHLVPGTPLELGDQESRIPIILIQRPGASASSQTNLSYSSGWDLVLPSGFAMAFWVALVYRGARVGGIREARSVDLQAGLLSVPDSYPDSQAGQTEMKAGSEARQAKHDRMPPAKRPNFVKLGFTSPFRFEFERLVKEWHSKWNSTCGDKVQGNVTGKGSMFVLRNRKMLRLLNSALSNPKSFCKVSKKSNNSSNNNHEKVSVVETLLETETGKKLVADDLPSIVPVRLSVLQRGVPATYGHICQPSDDDLRALNDDKTYGGPMEPKHRDPGMAARKEERKERLRLRKKRKRGKAKRAAEGASAKTLSTGESELLLMEQPQPSEASTAQGQEDSDQKVSEPGLSCSILGSTTRDVVGFVKAGDFDLATGQGLGFGFCSVAALLSLVEQQRDRRDCLVLVRNPTSLQYRFATVTLVLP